MSRRPFFVCQMNAVTQGNVKMTVQNTLYTKKYEKPPFEQYQKLNIAPREVLCLPPPVRYRVMYQTMQGRLKVWL